MEGLERLREDLGYFSGKKVFVTGHTGFKGSWLVAILKELGSEVFGFSLPPPTNPSLYMLADVSEGIHEKIGDIRDFALLNKSIKDFQPEVIIHLAAQPLVMEGYRDPIGTYSTNVMGTVNILEAVRRLDRELTFLNVTTDKVYKNREWFWGYRENEELNGFDPYSNSKSCSELVTQSFNSSYFKDSVVRISTARAGNVIGGGDFSANRIIPDCVRSALRKEPIIVRNPDSVRPYQHVLEPLFAYLLILSKQVKNPSLCGNYNVGPNEGDCLRTSQLVRLFCHFWGENLSWEAQNIKGSPHEANLLRLDISKIKSELGWKPVWNAPTAVEKTVEWSKMWRNSRSTEMEDFMIHQIREYLRDADE